MPPANIQSRQGPSNTIKRIPKDTPITDPVSGTVSRPWVDYLQHTDIQSAAEDLLRLSAWNGSATSQSGMASVIFDTHANRLANYPAANYVAGSQLFYETDRTVLYIVDTISGTNQWIYLSGVMEDADAGLANLPNDLTSHDSGFLYRSTTFYRVWLWNGTAWHYFESGLGAGAEVTVHGGTPPSGGLWGAANGSSYSCALDNATVGSFTSDNVSDVWLRR